MARTGQVLIPSCVFFIKPTVILPAHWALSSLGVHWLLHEQSEAEKTDIEVSFCKHAPKAKSSRADLAQTTGRNPPSWDFFSAAPSLHYQHYSMAGRQAEEKIQALLRLG